MAQQYKENQNPKNYEGHPFDLLMGVIALSALQRGFGVKKETDFVVTTPLPSFGIKLQHCVVAYCVSLFHGFFFLVFEMPSFSFITTRSHTTPSICCLTPSHFTMGLHQSKLDDELMYIPPRRRRRM